MKFNQTNRQALMNEGSQNGGMDNVTNKMTCGAKNERAEIN